VAATTVSDDSTIAPLSDDQLDAIFAVADEDDTTWAMLGTDDAISGPLSDDFAEDFIIASADDSDSVSEWIGAAWTDDAAIVPLSDDAIDQIFATADEEGAAWSWDADDAVAGPLADDLAQDFVIAAADDFLEPTWLYVPDDTAWAPLADDPNFELPFPIADDSTDLSWIYGTDDSAASVALLVDVVTGPPPVSGIYIADLSAAPASIANTRAGIASLADVKAAGAIIGNTSTRSSVG
jgi:hypothetical protein